MPKSKAKLAHHAPIFPVTDMPRAVAYYTGPLGFEVSFEWEEDGHAYTILRRDGCELHLSLAPRPHRTIAYFFVDGVQALYRAMTRRKADMACPLADQPWDMREFEVRDPDGNGLIFGEHL